MHSVLLATVRPDPLGMLVAFGAGVASFVSPCVLPLVPAYVGLVAGVKVGDLIDGEVDRSSVFLPTLLFVAGFSVVFVMLGAGASSVGSALSNDKRLLEVVSGLLTVCVGVLFATGMSPSFLQVERRFHVSPGEWGRWAPVVMGAAFAFGWTPCIGPVLGAVLSQAAARSTLVGGVALLAAYSLGLGVPFVAFGLATGRLAGAHRWAKSHRRAIGATAGLLMVAWGAVMVAGDVSVVSGWFASLLRDLHLTRLTVS